VDDHPDLVGASVPQEGLEAGPVGAGEGGPAGEGIGPSVPAESEGEGARKAVNPGQGGEATAPENWKPAMAGTLREKGNAPLALVVDDDATSRVFARSLLELDGCRVVEAEDGQAALKLLEGGSETPALVILDLSMPRMDGEEFLRTLRASSVGSDVAVIVVTVSSDTATEIRLVEAGADDFVRKPVEPRLFVSRVNALLRRIQG
jgi:CheY-like chemotaxis protein